MGHSKCSDCVILKSPLRRPKNPTALTVVLGHQLVSFWGDWIVVQKNPTAPAVVLRTPVRRISETLRLSPQGDNFMSNSSDCVILSKQTVSFWAIAKNLGHWFVKDSSVAPLPQNDTTVVFPTNSNNALLSSICPLKTQQKTPLREFFVEFK